MHRFVVVLAALLQNVGTLQDPMLSGMGGLSELPLEKLLQVKSTLDEGTDLLYTEDSSDGEDIGVKLDTSQAQALHGKGKPKRPFPRGSYEMGWQKKGGKKGLSKIFQASITALAFLAFGGYLLCLLVQAIRSKSATTNTNTNLITTAGGGLALSSGINAGGGGMIIANVKRRPLRHRREAVWPAADPESLYYALKMFSEGFATYHTVDYKYYNFTADSLG